ncbi:MAG: Maf-like protein [Planctomycetales bacterium]|nr:Maf-like protein [Planctomycetales bacterium]
MSRSIPANLGPLVLASGSPRRRQLMADAGYPFRVEPPDDGAECGVCSGESPAKFAMRMAWLKAQDVALRHDTGCFVGCDTVVECAGQVIGKPRDEEDARRILTLLSGREHLVISGLCLWLRPSDQVLNQYAVTHLVMDEIAPADLDAYLATDLWIGKAGAFGYQDGLDWVHVVRGSESNVVGLPMELFASMLAEVNSSP